MPSPSPTVFASAPRDLNDHRGAELEPGTYTNEAFAPRITLEVGAGWTAAQLFDGFFDIQQDVGSPDVIAVQFARPSSVAGADGATSVADAAGAADALSVTEGLTVLESSDSRIGGFDGHQVTVENADTTHRTVLWVPPGPLGIDPGRRLWVAFFDTDDGLLAIMIGGSVAHWGEALAAAEPVLESVTIGD